MKTVNDISSKIDFKSAEGKARTIIAVIFMICFLISLGYFLYNVYEIYITPIELKTIPEISRDAVHQFVGFQAAILSFLLFVAALKI